MSDACRKTIPKIHIQKSLEATKKNKTPFLLSMPDIDLSTEYSDVLASNKGEQARNNPMSDIDPKIVPLNPTPSNK